MNRTARVHAGAGTALVLLLALPLAVWGQDHDHAHEGHADPALPDGWMAHFDQAHAGHGAEGLEFVEMAPGWHITTGPSGIFHRHEFRSEGTYRLEAEIHLFDPGARRESFGVFFGGRELHGEGQRYSYFLVRRTGEFMIRHRAGEDLHDIQGWTAHEAVRGWDDREEGSASVLNVLAVEVGSQEVVFEVNGREVARRPRADLDVDGHYGLRVNHNLNLHVARIEAVPLNP
jgi:hypothetical protein